MSGTKLARIRIRMYEVGWGDCFLLSFAYSGGVERHVLIDFGTTAGGAADERLRLLPIAEDIAERCGGKLDAVVATHRHHDHIGGFTALKKSASPGNVIARLDPSLVIQSWTENPALESSLKLSSEIKALTAIDGFSTALQEMLAASPLEMEANHKRQLLQLLRQNQANHGAIRSLQRLGKRRLYVTAGSRTGLETLLPGFSVRVLGPARPGKRHAWTRLLENNPREGWAQPLADNVLHVADPRAKPLFPRTPQWHPALAPPGLRCFVEQINQLRSGQILSLARSLNSEVNNTSVVLLIEGFGHKLLFGGDTELQGWARILHNPDTRRLVSGATVYKVSHHGAVNGTPRSLWDIFERARPEIGKGRMSTLLSTRRHVATDPSPLMERFATDSLLFDTASLREKNALYRDVELEPFPPAVATLAS